MIIFKLKNILSFNGVVLAFFLFAVGACSRAIQITPISKVNARATLETDIKTTTGTSIALRTSTLSSTSTSTSTSVELNKPLDLTKYYKLLSSSTETQNKCLEANQNDSLVRSGGAFMDDCHNTTGQFWKLSANADSSYKLTTQFYEPLNKCLEANAPGSNVHSQASFMDTCTNINSQSWKLVPELSKPGYYRVIALSLESQNRCLQANVPNDNLHDGAVFLEICQGSPGQLWKLANPSTGITPGGLELGSVEPFDPGRFYKIKSKLLETASKCLEANQTGSGIHGGGIFMDTCLSSNLGQMWKLTSLGGGFYKLTTQLLDPLNPLCLESANPPNISFMYGCGNFTGQSWKMIPQADGYFQLTSQFRDPFGECLVSNQTNAVLNDGASHMEPCQNVPAQLWKIILQ